jgi:hypothetical protein
METVIAYTALSVAVLIGLGALGVGIGMWHRCCRRRCLSSLHCSMPLP